MDSIIKKISEIETTAEAIVEHAEAQKTEIEKKIQAKRDAFDQQLEEETQAKLRQIKGEANTRMEAILGEQRQKNHSTIENLEKEFEEQHSAYAKEILEHIIEG